LELKDYLRFVGRWWWLMGLTAAAAATLAFAITSRETPIYAATTKLLVNQNQGQFAQPKTTFDELRVRERLAQTYIELLRSRPVMERAIADLNLNMRPRTLAGKIDVEAVGGTELILVTVHDPDPRRAETMANAVVVAFQALERDLLANPFASESSLVVVELALATISPVSPNIPRTLIIALVLGLFIAMLIGFLRDFFDDTMSGGGDMQRRTGYLPAATVGNIGGPSKLITSRDPYHATSESYRMLRMHLDAFPSERALQTIVITSPNPRDGKSTTAANLAIAMAQTGRSVILVDADLREPTLHKLFGQENTSGVSNLLVQGGACSSLATYLRPTQIDRLRLLPAGVVNFHPAQLLGSEPLVALVDALKAEADLIIFDTPALLSVVDASLILRAADAALLVVGAGVSRGADVLRAYANLEQLGVSILGIVLNKARVALRPGQSHYSWLHSKAAKGGDAPPSARESDTAKPRA